MTAQNYLTNEKLNKKSFDAKRAIIILLSIIAITGVFWWLKLIGITMAGEAFCGMDEHTHTEECRADGCDIAEHIHLPTCYSNPNADVETKSEWESTFADIQLSGDLAEDLIAIAKTQIGYQESTLNYTVSSDGITRGYTRYGAWYGNEYGDWSAMFAGFCLNYSGIDSELAPYNSGSETMRMLWDNKAMFTNEDSYSPSMGDIVFLDKDGNGKSDAVGIVLMNDFSNIMTIEGDINNTVDRATYSLDDTKILGYGMLNCVLRKTVDAEYLEYIDGVKGLIDELPSLEEFDQKLYSLEDDMDAYAEYFSGVKSNVNFAYMLYCDIDDHLAPLVTNSQKLLSLKEFLPEPYATVAQTGGIVVYQSNTFSYPGYAFTVWGNTVTNILNTSQHPWINQFQLKDWTLYRIEYRGDDAAYASYFVAEIYGIGVDKRNIKASTTDGFLLFVNSAPAAKVKQYDSATVWNTSYANADPFYKGKRAAPASASDASVPNSAGIGGVNFGTTAQSIVRNNGLSTIKNVPDTSSFIEINLFNYNADTSGPNINTKFTNDRTSSYPYPAFTRTNVGHGSDYVYPTYGFAFGDWIVADVGFQENLHAYNVTDSTASNKKRLGINAIVGNADKPNQGYMMPTLVNGYPALKGNDAGTVSKSLKYLFSTEESYVSKQNSSNITGLFQYDANKKLYYFDSRQNHAEYNSATGRFDLYNETITSNFIMYPFGNFLPFNSINTQSAEVGVSSTLVSKYFKEIAVDSMSAYFKTYDHKYLGMTKVMDKVIAGMNKDYGTDSWTVYNLLTKYKNTTFANLVQSRGTLLDLYNIDFSRESDFFFGMDIHFDFFQPENGNISVNNGTDPMIFDFVGDDDVWVYIDDVLFLDLSGIHSHVGGKIDFRAGEVYYYQLEDFTGQVSSTHYSKTTFRDILKAAGKTDAEISKILNANGTFTTYSTHSLDFYYMERGSGSSICSINFNIPVLEKNAIEISKELQGETDGLGNPDYLFQIIKNTDYSRLVDEGYPYSVYDADGNFIEERTIEANGIIRIKAGQTAKVGNINENSGAYFIRELLTLDQAAQCDKVVIRGGSTSPETLNANFSDFSFGGVQYKGIASGTGNANSSYRFIAENTMNNAFASLEVEKVQIEYTPDAEIKDFTFELLFDGQPIPVGTKYTVVNTNGTTAQKTIETEGRFVLSGGQKAKFSNIYAGSLVKLSEIGATEYVVSITYEGGKNFTYGNDSISGIALSNTIMKVLVTNDREGKKLTINGDKTLINPDGSSYEYSFELTEVELDPQSGIFTEKVGGLKLIETILFDQNASNGETKDLGFYLNLPSSIYDAAGTYYFKISEIGATATNGKDTNFFILKVTFDTLGNPVGTIQKNGTGNETQTFGFENLIVRKLKITKTVEGVVTPNIAFDFVLNATFNGAPLNGEYLCEGAVDKISFINGRATVSLKDGEYVEIFSLPYGAEISVFESKDGYYTEYCFEGETERTSANEATLNLESDTVINFFNIGGNELPATGSYAREIFTIIGGAIVLLAFAMACVLRYYRKKRA